MAWVVRAPLVLTACCSRREEFVFSGLLMMAIATACAYQAYASKQWFYLTTYDDVDYPFYVHADLEQDCVEGIDLADDYLCYNCVCPCTDWEYP
jgi:hypothetical protein